MERSLDKKYQSKTFVKSNESKEERNIEEDFDIRKLEQNLMKFEESRVGAQNNNNNKENNYTVSEVTKVVSSTDPYKNEGNSSMKIREPNSYSHITENTYSWNKDHYSSKYTPKNNKTSNIMNSIDDKYSKYVLNSKNDHTFKKSSKIHSYGNDYDPYSYRNDRKAQANSSGTFYNNQSRMATGKFY